jgi:hypothetical protein
MAAPPARRWTGSVDRSGRVGYGLAAGFKQRKGSMMNSKLEALGIALVAALAIGALAAPAAQAQEFHSEVEHTILMSKSIGAQLFSMDVGNLECKEVSLNEAESTIGPEASTTGEVPATPEYAECVKAGTSTGVYFDFATNGCGYVFTSETDATEHAQVHIECANGGDTEEGGPGILTRVTAFKLNCLDFPPQTVGGNETGSGVHYTNTGAGAGRTIDVEATISEEIHYTQTGVCGEGTKFNGSYTGVVEVEGTDTNEEQVGVWTEGGAPPPPEEFHSSASHTVLMGEQRNTQVIGTTVGNIECTGVTFDEEHSTIGPEDETTEVLTVRPVYTNCLKFETAMYPEFGECGYGFQGETDAEERAQVSVECPEEEEVEIKATAFKVACVNIPPQTVSGASYANKSKGSGSGDIDVNMALVGIKYDEKGVCQSGGENGASNGTYEGEITVRGTDTEGTLKELWFE